MEMDAMQCAMERVIIVMEQEDVVDSSAPPFLTYQPVLGPDEPIPGTNSYYATLTRWMKYPIHVLDLLYVLAL
jgi:hypothetical protein